MINIAQPQLEDDEKKALIEVLDSKILVQGPKVAEFEKNFADYADTKFGIATSSGTTALAISLMALGISPGDEIITSPFTFIATATSIRLCGANPVFVDVDPDTFNINPDLVEEAISPKTKAILPVHLYGLTADVIALQKIADKHSLGLVEDACQSHGSKIGDKKAGSFGNAGCFSFYPTKNITTGEGGIITTSEGEYAENCRLIRNHGQQERYHYARLGFNYRMTEFAGALGCVQLKKLDRFNSKRQENAKRLNEIFSGEIQTPFLPDNYTHVFHQYTIKLPSQKHRDQLKEYLFGKSIGTAVYYPIGLNEIEFLQGRSVGSLKNTKKLTQTVLSLPVHPGLSPEDMEKVGKEVLSGLKSIG